MKLGVARQSHIDIWFDNLRLMEGKLSRRPMRKTSKEYLQGMMGIEVDAIEQIKDGLVLNGMNKSMAAKKAKTFVNSVKRRCLTTLHQLFTSTKEKQNQ
ncbi:hypothetical protein D3C80_1583450 [compost metagenome]